MPKNNYIKGDGEVGTGGYMQSSKTAKAIYEQLYFIFNLTTLKYKNL